MKHLLFRSFFGLGLFVMMFFSMTVYAGVDDMPGSPENSTSSTGLTIGDVSASMMDFYVDKDNHVHIFFVATNSSLVCSEDNRLVEVYKTDATTWASRCPARNVGGSELSGDEPNITRQTIAVAYDEVNDAAWLALKQDYSGLNDRIQILKRDEGLGEVHWTSKRWVYFPDIDWFYDLHVDGDSHGGVLALTWVGSSRVQALIYEDINDDTFTLKNSTSISVNGEESRPGSVMLPDGTVYFQYGPYSTMKFREWIPGEGAGTGLQSEEQVSTDENASNPGAIIYHPSTLEPAIFYVKQNVSPEELRMIERVGGVWQTPVTISGTGDGGGADPKSASAEYLSNGDISVIYTWDFGEARYLQRIGGSWESKDYSQYSWSGLPKRHDIVIKDDYTYIAGADDTTTGPVYFMTDGPQDPASPSVPEYETYAFIAVMLVAFGLMVRVLPRKGLKLR